MTALFVIGAVLLLFCALAMTTVRIDGSYEDGVFTLTGWAGPVPVKLFPRRKDREKGPERNARGPLRRLSAPMLRLLADCGCGFLGRIVPRSRVRKLRARYTAGGPDPYRAAMAYARAGVAMEGAARLVEGADLRADVDFEGGRPSFAGDISIGARLWALVWAAACFGTDFLRGYYRYKRERE